MRRIRIAFLLAVFAVATLGATTPAEARKCGQYPTFIEPIICRI